MFRPIALLNKYLERLILFEKKNKRHLIVTQNGRRAAMLSASTHQTMVDKIELLEDVKFAEAQIVKGQEITHHTVKQRFAKKA